MAQVAPEVMEEGNINIAQGIHQYDDEVANNEIHNKILKIIVVFLIGFSVPYWILPETKGMFDKETDKMVKPFISVCCGLLLAGYFYKYIE